MAGKLFRLVVSAQTRANASVRSYFYTVTAGASAVGATTYKFSSSKFVGGNNSTVTTFPVSTASGYYTLFIDGVMQQTGFYTVGPAGTAISLASATAFDIRRSAPVTLSLTQYAPTTAITG